METEFKKVAYIGLRGSDGSYLQSVPLYVKASDINTESTSATEEEILHRISEIMVRRYEKQIAEFMANKQKEKANEKKGR